MLLTIGSQQLLIVGELCSIHPPVLTIIKPNKANKELTLPLLLPMSQNTRNFSLNRLILKLNGWSSHTPAIVMIRMQQRHMKNGVQVSKTR